MRQWDNVLLCFQTTHALPGDSDKEQTGAQRSIHSLILTEHKLYAKYPGKTIVKKKIHEIYMLIQRWYIFLPKLTHSRVRWPGGLVFLIIVSKAPVTLLVLKKYVLLNDIIRAGCQIHTFDSKNNILSQLYAGTNLRNKYNLHLSLIKLIMSGQDGGDKT